MADRLFATVRETNPNAAIMIVENEEDNYHGSIGDAVATHVHEIHDNAAAMIMWNEIIHMQDGNMYRMVPSWEENDRDPHNMRGREIEDLKQKLSTQLSREIFEEIFQVERDRREAAGEVETEDALDQEIIPYDDWEKFPGIWEKMELCTTPRNRALYMGNTSQEFYDVFPEGHPDASKINSFLRMLNREGGVDEGYAEWVVEQIEATPMRRYTKDCLSWLAYAIARDPSRVNDYVTTKEVTVFVDNDIEFIPETKEIAVFNDGYITKALRAIDKHWKVEYLNSAAKKSLANPMTRLLLKKEREWNKLAKEGVVVYNIIKKFGQLLFRDFKNQMNGYHWARYRRVRDRHAPRIILKGVDLNRCNLGQLSSVLRVDREEATKVWHARPFTSLEHAYSLGYVNTLSFASDEDTDSIVVFIEKHAKIAREYKDLHRMNDVRKVLLSIQEKKEKRISSDQWSSIWRYYNILKTNLLEAINRKG